ncbi:hypothetical protein [Alteromonas macleodii]|uniref:hypothetical protein n=1 Tax=Alteromonas macleodii TaxID=28108 RepID=UPI00068B87A9|nr:hypothetical protein [Alteromonas macleodii]
MRSHSSNRLINPLQFAVMMLFLSLPSLICADEFTIEPHSVSLADRYQLESVGAFRLLEGTHGESRAAFAIGKIAVTSDDTSLYLAGHAHHFSVGSYDIAGAFAFGSIDELPIAPISQNFVKINPELPYQESATRITGLELHEGRLLVTVDKYYDADVKNKENFLFFENAVDLEKTIQFGFFPLQSRSHSTGWMSKIPAPLAGKFGADYLIGSASNLPINSRNSIGPTFFTWTPPSPKHSIPLGKNINTSAKLDYSLAEPLSDDSYNESGNNDLWTELSTAELGFISPDQQSYIVVGTSGGHHSGIGYKITQNNGRKCNGPCAYAHDDYYNYYWIYSIEDILAVHYGEKLPSEVAPTSYGKLPTYSHEHLIIGADFNPISNMLYLTIAKADASQNRFESQPVIVGYEFITH